MRVLISPEADVLMKQPRTSGPQERVLTEAIRHALDRLRQNQYFFCTHLGARSALWKFDGTCLALYYRHSEQVVVLFCRPEPDQRLNREFFEHLLPRCGDFHVS